MESQHQQTQQYQLGIHSESKNQIDPVLLHPPPLPYSLSSTASSVTNVSAVRRVRDENGTRYLTTRERVDRLYQQQNQDETMKTFPVEPTLGSHHNIISGIFLTEGPDAASETRSMPSRHHYPDIEYPPVKTVTSEYPEAKYPATRPASTHYPPIGYPESSAMTALYPSNEYPECSYANSPYPGSSYPSSHFPDCGFPTNQFPASNYPSSRLPTSSFPVNPLPSSNFPDSGIYPISYPM